MPESKVHQQFAVQYVNHYNKKVVTLGNWDALMDTTDIIRDLKQQRFEPKVLRREITVTYGDWEPV